MEAAPTAVEASGRSGGHSRRGTSLAVESDDLSPIVGSLTPPHSVSPIWAQTHYGARARRCRAPWRLNSRSGRCRPRRERIAMTATPRPVLRPLGKAQGQRCRTQRHLRGLPHTEHPPQPARGLRHRIIGAVGSTRRRSARRRTGCVAAAPPAAHEAQDSRWLQDSADSVAWAAHSMPESPREISRPG
jgi:hypothetical protein